MKIDAVTGFFKKGLVASKCLSDAPNPLRFAFENQLDVRIAAAMPAEKLL
jgi:hypothetical protein